MKNKVLCPVSTPWRGQVKPGILVEWVRRNKPHVRPMNKGFLAGVVVSMDDGDCFAYVATEGVTLAQGRGEVLYTLVLDSNGQWRVKAAEWVGVGNDMPHGPDEEAA